LAVDAGKPIPNVNDGFTADSAGGRREIHVQPFPSGDGRWPVSVNGGDWPRWSKDGRVRARRD
jgi:hypothetical protein